MHENDQTMLEKLRVLAAHEDEDLFDLRGFALQKFSVLWSENAHSTSIM